MGVSEQVESGDRWRVRFLPTAPTLVLVLTSPQLGLNTCVSNRGALDGGRYQQDTNTETKTNTNISDQSPKIPTTISGYLINTSVSNRLPSTEKDIRGSGHSVKSVDISMLMIVGECFFVECQLFNNFVWFNSVFERSVIPELLFN